MRLRIFVFLFIALGAAVLAQEVAHESPSPAGLGDRLAELLRQGIDTADPAVGEALAPVLAAWIAQSRDAAIARGVAEMPVEIRAAFEQFIPARILDTVRWRVDGDTGVLGRIVFQPGAIRAVTLDNVIVFANAGEAANIKLWAHELHHVTQYSRWGVAGFAERFIVDRRMIEHEAREFRWSWMRSTGRIPRV